MSEQFNDWWNGNDLTIDNPFKQDTPAFWAWEGWVAGVKAELPAPQPPREWVGLTDDVLKEKNGTHGTQFTPQRTKGEK